MPSPLELRIKNIQKKLQVPQTGIFDLATCKAFETLRSLNVTASDLQTHLKEIQKSLGFTGTQVDGQYGLGTISRIEMIFDTTLPTLPPGTSMVVSKKGLEAIIQYEVSSKKNYNNKLKAPMWPGGASGITIGIGYDLGHNSAEKITSDWKKHLSAGDLAKLLKGAKIKGEKARLALSDEIKSVDVSYEAAIEVFNSVSVPEFARKVVAIYPGVAALPPDAQSAILSLLYNRGYKLEDDIDKKTNKPNNRRLEMRNLVPLVSERNLKAIANEFRKMKRLWDINKAGGLIARREDEAKLVENGTWQIPPTEYIFV